MQDERRDVAAPVEEPPDFEQRDGQTGDRNQPGQSPAIGSDILEQERARDDERCSDRIGCQDGEVPLRSRQRQNAPLGRAWRHEKAPHSDVGGADRRAVGGGAEGHHRQISLRQPDLLGEPRQPQSNGDAGEILQQPVGGGDQARGELRPGWLQPPCEPSLRGETEKQGSRQRQRDTTQESYASGRAVGAVMIVGPAARPIGRQIDDMRDRRIAQVEPIDEMLPELLDAGRGVWI